MLSSGNSFGGSPGLGVSVGDAIGDGAIRWPAPTWKLGLRQSDDRGDI